MGIALQKSTFKKIFLFSALLLGIAFQGVYGQTALSPGDITIVTVNADGDDNFDFVPLVDLENGTEIYFTDNAYVDVDGVLKDNEGTVTYTASSSVPAGTVVSYNGSDGNDFEQTSGNYSAAASGDNIITYQIDSSTNDTTYLHGTGWARGDSWNYNDDTNSSDIPPNLSEEDNTIVDLGTTDNYQYDADNGLEGTATTLLSLIGDESNWIEDDENAFSAFATDFTLIDPPTVAFTTSSFSGEEGNTVEIDVELVEENSTAVDVDIEFLSSSSTASSSDIDDFSVETISFTDSDTSGTEKTVNITLIDDSEFEGNEKAVFQLQNNTEGSIIDPAVITLTITDNDAPDIVFNEINADPGNDANGDGDTDTDTDEFIEWVNNTNKDIDISGWKYQDSGSADYIFPEGTVIPAGNAVVLFDNTGDIQPQGNFGGAYIFTDNEVGLNNTPEELTLKDESGNIVETVTYNEISGESNVLSPEITGDTYVAHSTLSSNDLLSSPGTQVNGTPFGSKHAIGIRGSEGWRMISSPVQSATFEDFFGDFWMQGLTGSNDVEGDGTIFSWDESGGGTFTAPANMSDNLDPGKGYIVYFFEDDDNNAPGIQGGFPKIINSDGTENGTVDDISVTANDESGNGAIDENEGWNLLGNPFDTDIVVSEVVTALESVNENVNANVHVWDHEADNGNGAWIALSGDDTIAPFQGFFVRYEAVSVNGNVSFSKNDLEANKGAEFFKNSIEDVITFDLQLHGEQYYDTYSLEFSENGTTELDRFDAYKLFSLNPDAISLFSTLSNNRLRKNALPIDLDSNLEIPLSLDANGRSSLTFQWDDKVEDIPNEWDLILIDNEQNREIDLRRNNEYSFTVNADQQEESQISSDKKGLLNKSKVTQDSRFILSVQPNIQGGITSDLPESVKLKPNYPNPFNPTTTIPYELAEDSDVLLTVWNMIGQKVATLVDGTVEAGTHEVNWNASDMPSGMYIARFEVNGTVFTRKMTLIK